MRPITIKTGLVDVVLQEKFLDPLYRYLYKEYGPPTDDNQPAITAADESDENDAHGDVPSLPPADWSNYRGQQFSKTELEFLDSFEDEFPERQYGIHREDIGGLDKIISRLEAFKRGIEHRNLYDVMGVTPPNGFILVGPPGTGKTYIAKYMAEDVGARFADLPLNRYESKWVGDAEKKLAKYINTCRTYYEITGQKVLLFFDEAEEAFKSRSLDGHHGPRVNVLLREMDGLGNNNGIIFGAATNHIDKVDEALMRAGRLDFIINMPEYGAKEMGEVYVATANRLNRVAPHHDPYGISPQEAFQLGQASKSKGLQPADVKEVFRLAAEERIRTIVELPEDLPCPLEYTRVGYAQLRESLKNYERETVKRRIGFDI